MQDHDGWYKKLFSRETVEHLVRGFVREPWVEEIDFATLEPWNSSFVGEQLERRESDAVWRVEFRGKPLYVCFLIEFQSTVERTMALRILAYVALLYQEIAEQEKHRNGPLPPVIPIVLYNGEAKWTAPVEVAELIAPGPPELARFRPRLSFLLIDELRRSDDPVPADNLAKAIFGLEASRSEAEMAQVLAGVAPALANNESLRRTLIDWIFEELLPHRIPGEKLERPASLKEALEMLQTHRRSWAEIARDEGLEEGLEKGVRKGIRKGEARVLERLLTVKFGALPEDVRKRLDRAGERQLLRWNERCLTADSLEAVFAD